MPRRNVRSGAARKKSAKARRRRRGKMTRRSIRRELTKSHRQQKGKDQRPLQSAFQNPVFRATLHPSAAFNALPGGLPAKFKTKMSWCLVGAFRIAAGVPGPADHAGYVTLAINKPYDILNDVGHNNWWVTPAAGAPVSPLTSSRKPLGYEDLMKWYDQASVRAVKADVRFSAYVDGDLDDASSNPASNSMFGDPLCVWMQTADNYDDLQQLIEVDRSERLMKAEGTQSLAYQLIGPISTRTPAEAQFSTYSSIPDIQGRTGVNKGDHDGNTVTSSNDGPTNNAYMRIGATNMSLNNDVGDDTDELIVSVQIRLTMYTMFTEPKPLGVSAAS